MEENRQQKRLPLSTDATVLRLSSGDRMDAELVDISCYGASLKTSATLKANEQIMVSITLDKEGAVVQSEEAPGTVRWVERSGEAYLAGIMFNIKINDKKFPIFNESLEYLKTRG